MVHNTGSVVRLGFGWNGIGTAQPLCRRNVRITFTKAYKRIGRSVDRELIEPDIEVANGGVGTHFACLTRIASLLLLFQLARLLLTGGHNRGSTRAAVFFMVL